MCLYVRVISSIYIYISYLLFLSLSLSLSAAIASLSSTTMTPLYHAEFLSHIFDGELSGVQVYAKVLELLKNF